MAEPPETPDEELRQDPGIPGHREPAEQPAKGEPDDPSAASDEGARPDDPDYEGLQVRPEDES